LALEVPPYYVYILQRPDGVPFYVGEGVKTRVLEHALTARRGHRIGESNPHKCNVIRKIEKAGGTVRYAIMSTHQTKIEAQREEGRLIAAIGRACENGTLTNLHPGRETGLGMHPETEARRAATLSYDPKNLPEDMETRALHELMHSVVPVNSNPLKPRSRYQGTKVRHTTGTTKSRQPKPRSAGALATLASLTAGSIVEGTLLPRAFLYDGIPAILENGVANDLVGTQVIEVIPASDPSDERFRITSTGTRALQDILGAELLTTLGLET
jgi:hypothetical protein